MSVDNIAEQGKNPEVEQLVSEIDGLRREIVIKNIFLHLQTAQIPQDDLLKNLFKDDNIVVCERTRPSPNGEREFIYDFGIEQTSGLWASEGSVTYGSASDYYVLESYALASDKISDFDDVWASYQGAKLRIYELNSQDEDYLIEQAHDQIVLPWIEENRVPLLAGLKEDLSIKLAEFDNSGE